MAKKQVQSRVSYNGKPLPLTDFTWDEENRVFSSEVDDLVLDFRNFDNIVFNTGNYCTFITGNYCTFITGNYCTFKTGEQCVIIRRDIYEVISNKIEVQLCPYNIKGHLEKINGIWCLNGDMSLGEHILADSILSKVLFKKRIGSSIVYKIYNYTTKGMSEIPSYLIKIDDVYAHGDSIRDARDSLMYKVKDKDTSAYTGMTLDTVYTIPEAIKMYRTITGACSQGVKMFVEGMDKVPNRITVKEILDVTEGKYNHHMLKEFIDKTK